MSIIIAEKSFARAYVKIEATNGETAVKGTGHGELGEHVVTAIDDKIVHLKSRPHKNSRVEPHVCTWSTEDIWIV